MCISLTLKRDGALSAFACRSAQEMQRQIWLFSERNSFYNSFKAKSQRAIRLHSGESIFIIFALFDVNSLMLILRAKIAVSAVICMILYVFVRIRDMVRVRVTLSNLDLDKVVMNTPKRRNSWFVFRLNMHLIKTKKNLSIKLN